MKVIKLSKAQYERSLKANNMDHLFIYNQNINDKKPRRTGISLNMYTGLPQMCIVLEAGKAMCDNDIEKIFGKGAFINGETPPDDKEQMAYDVYYLKS